MSLMTIERSAQSKIPLAELKNNIETYLVHLGYKATEDTFSRGSTFSSMISLSPKKLKATTKVIFDTSSVEQTKINISMVFDTTSQVMTKSDVFYLNKEANNLVSLCEGNHINTEEIEQYHKSTMSQTWSGLWRFFLTFFVVSITLGIIADHFIPGSHFGAIFVGIAAGFRSSKKYWGFSNLKEAMDATKHSDK